ncbi:hypothetical protein [Aureimonas pseudogalii]|uniref:Uncharacterized protein n=1 Tax=Aureimonas pseudogalii TaxID=1744844 RepID=A0A7W6E8J1_9HYPH|nr:hypothetical protein [Aureimonas pseudogalii]MBB3996189.1 hypothetical protein [Aureimonas pseudogalii]
MSDPRSFRDRKPAATAPDAGGDGGIRGIPQPLTQGDIDDVLSNLGMTIDEKREWLAAYAGQMADRDQTDRGGEFEPLEMRIRDALSMLAEGGHTYASADAADVDPDDQADTHPLHQDGRTEV